MVDAVIALRLAAARFPRASPRERSIDLRLTHRSSDPLLRLYSIRFSGVCREF